MFCKNPHCIGTKEFELSDQEKRLLIDFDVDAQSIIFCPQCREMRRLAFRNERNLFKRKCDSTGELIWSTYTETSPFKIFSKEVWWGDSWEATEYGRDFDFGKPFFQQFYDLMLDVPRPSLIQNQNKNSDYSHGSASNNDCYMVFMANRNVNCHYGSFFGSKDSMDCDEVYNCELCYDCLYCIDCHSVVGSEYCTNSSNVYFSSNLINCHNCIFCFGLRDKKNCIFNTEVSPEVFANFIMQRQLFRRKLYQKAKEMYQMFLETAPQRFMYILKSENCTGDRIVNSKDCENCYSAENTIACSNMGASIFDAKDSMDCWAVAHGVQKCYESQSILNGGFNFVVNQLINSSNCLYCDNCYDCQDCFGCVGLKNKKYHIFNKAYSPEDYKTLKVKLIQHLKAHNEWGHFFPMWMSPYDLNDTVAFFYYPLKPQAYAEIVKLHEKLWPPSKQYSISNLWNKECRVKKQEKMVQPTDSIFEAKSEEVLSTVYTDAKTKEPYQIMGRELAFYQKMKLPIPGVGYKTRCLERLGRYNERKLFNRNCHKCGKNMKTAFKPDSPYIVFCEDCFQKSLT